MELKDLYNYEIKLDSKTRKTLGVVYTPINIAISMSYLSLSSWMRNKTGGGFGELSDNEKFDLINNVRILDPCTGTGIFLHGILVIVSQIYNSVGKDFNREEASTWMKKCLFASDIDMKALDEAKYGLREIWGIEEEVLTSNIVCGDSIFNNHGFTEVIPKFKLESGGYWDMILNESSLDIDVDSEFPVDDGETVLELYNKYKDNKSDRNIRFEYIVKALDYNGIDASAWRDTEMPLSFYLEFMDVFVERNGFDIVVGNPPYVSIRNINGDIEELRKYRCFNTSADLSIYFYELGYNLINEDGIVCMISAKAWLNSKYALEFREWLFDKGNSKIKYLIDFHGTNVFSTANVSVAITVLDKQKRDKYKALYGDKDLINLNIEQRLINSPDVEVVKGAEGLRVSSEIEASIKEKYNTMKLQTQIKNYCTFRSGLTTGGKELFKVDETLYKKYPQLVKKAQDCRNLMNGTYFYMLYIPTGVYHNIKSLPIEVVDILESRREKLENRDATTIGEEWYSVKHGVNRITEGINCSIVNVSDDIRIYTLEEGAIPVDAAMICANAPQWVQNYLSNRLISAMYNVSSSAGNCRNSNLPRKSAKEINEIPVPFVLAECEDINDSDICEAFGLTDKEIIYLINLGEV